MKTTAFLPMRKGSQRIKNKNIKDFAGIKGGLAYIKLSQLLCTQVDLIIVSTNDEEVIDLALSFNSSKIRIDHRPQELANSSTSTDDLIKYVPTIVDSGIILWTHVTSPFVSANHYNDMLSKYFNNLSAMDSLMSVTKLQKFFWDQNNPINYDKTFEKWPRTQTIQPLYEVNSGAFIADINIYTELKDRIGKMPYLYELDSMISFDIDWPDDFLMAEALWSVHGKV